MEQMQAQAEHVGTEMVMDHIARSTCSRRPFRLEGDSGDTYTCDALIIATGAQARWLACRRRRSSRATASRPAPPATASSTRARMCVVVGGGNTAVEEALFLTNFADKVTIVHRRDSFRAEKIMQERLFKNPKIEVVWNTVLEEVIGHRRAEVGDRRALKNVKTGKMSEIKIDGVFIAIGHVPATELFKGQLEMNAVGLPHHRAGFDAHFRSPACSPPATSRTKFSARRSPRQAWAAWRRSRPSATLPSWRTWPKPRNNS